MNGNTTTLQRAIIAAQRVPCLKTPKPLPVPVAKPDPATPWLGRTSEQILDEMRSCQRLQISQEVGRNLVESVIRATAHAYGFRSSELKAVSREVPVCHARHVSMLLCRILTGRSSPFIGQMHGGRDHSTVIHGLHKLAWLGEQLHQLHTLADPPKEWAATAARLHPLPRLSRDYARRLPNDALDPPGRVSSEPASCSIPQGAGSLT